MSQTLTPILPEGWKRGSGYSHAVNDPIAGVTLVAGQFGQDPRTGKFAETFSGQWKQALQNVIEIARSVGGGPESIILLRVFVTSLDEYNASLRDVGAVQKEVLGKWFPATTMVQISRLVAPEAKIEIEAVISSRGGR
jgi:enamine deaminase RidA (YjgF/YER057c/UK114 family)